MVKRAHDVAPGPSIEWRTTMVNYIGLDVSLKETAISVRRDGKRVWRGKCASDPGACAGCGADIHEHGIVMTGGGSLLAGISDALAQATGVPVVIAEDPLTSVAVGAGRALEDEAYSGVMIES
jgi:hypothetical protein